MNTKTCANPNCQREFQAQNRRRLYCSEYCKRHIERQLAHQRHYQPTGTGTCLNCGAETKKSNVKYCSWRCQYQFYVRPRYEQSVRQPRPDRFCAECGQGPLPKYRRLCDECKKKGIRAHAKAYYERHKKKVLARHVLTKKLWLKTEKGKQHKAVHDGRRRARKQAVEHTLTNADWRQVLDYYGHKCLACGRSDIKLTIDHVVPLSRGGTHTIDNVQPLCLGCNVHKHTGTMDYRNLQVTSP